MEQIDLEDEVMEGRVYGWRWYAALHGPWLLISPTIPHRHRHAPPKQLAPEPGDEASWLHSFREHFNVADLHDWSYSDVAPRVDDAPYPHGFHVFSKYNDVIRKYAPCALSNCRGGFRVPPTWDANKVPASWRPWLKDWPDIDRLGATPVLAFVEMSGIIVEHEIGYRAQKVRPVRLFSTAGPKTRRLLADKLGWPDTIRRVRKFNSYPNPVESNLRRLEA